MKEKDLSKMLPVLQKYREHDTKQAHVQLDTPISLADLPI